MENLISLVNKIQRACTTLGNHGEASALPTLWDSLPAIAVVGGQELLLSILLCCNFIRFLKATENMPSFSISQEKDLLILMKMAITTAGIANIVDGKMGSSMGNSNSNLPNFISPFKIMKKVLSEGSSSSHGIPTAIGSRRVGSPQMLQDAVLAPKSLMPLKRRM
ncbi:hypothetical protein L484_026192 [Morus notabilis]|uniref:Uncharacterized protein n=1 Tax=Morus notabilis TaxID=981085 RepID=W9RUU0_9ROSA|nr:hypothetical protein L484_026192 [Morus notabilis]